MPVIRMFTGRVSCIICWKYRSVLSLVRLSLAICGSLPENAFLEVQYEDVIQDVEGQARRLIDYCGLEWDDACIAFYENKRVVRTASVAQVRKPVYKSSVERWRRYEKHLGPLLGALGDLTAKP